MDVGIISDLALGTMAIAFAVAIVAGFIKGLVGFAMPLILLSGLSSIMDPKLALGAMMLSVVVSNVIQMLRGGVGTLMTEIRAYWRYVLGVCVMIVISAQMVTLIPTRLFYFIIGVPIVALSLVQLAGVRPRVRPEQRKIAEWLMGVISGTLGGIAGTWGPTTVLFLLAMETPKTRQMVIQGVIYGLGSVTLFMAHIQSGIFNSATAPLSALLLLPAIGGMWIGVAVQGRLDQDRFRTVTLWVLLIAGMNLLRKAWVG